MKLGKIELRNNFIMSAVKTGYGNSEGNISDRHLAFWEKRSKHVGAVIFEPFFIDKKVRELPTQIGIDSDDKIEGKIPVHVVGDADQVGDAVSAIQSAYFICKEL